jgi:hypothetical protein
MLQRRAPPNAAPRERFVPVALAHSGRAKRGYKHCRRGGGSVLFFTRPFSPKIWGAALLKWGVSARTMMTNMIRREISGTMLTPPNPYLLHMPSILKQA